MGIYKGDLALVLFTPSKGDIVTITVVPRFNPSKKRKSNARVAPALLDPKFMAKFLPNENKIYIIGSHMFYPNRLESLQVPSAHALKIKPHPSEAELLLFQSSLMPLNAIYETPSLTNQGGCGTQEIRYKFCKGPLQTCCAPSMRLTKLINLPLSNLAPQSQCVLRSAWKI